MKKVSFLVAIILIGAFIVSIKEKVSASTTGIPERMNFSKLQLDTTGLGGIRTKALEEYAKNKKKIDFQRLLNYVSSLKKYVQKNKSFDSDKWIKKNQKDLALATVITNYGDMIKDTAKAYGIENYDIVFSVPTIESSGDPSVVDSTTQATGLWQVTPATGMIFGYSQEDLKDPAKCTSAGIRYYLMMLRRYKGDQKMALEAYNNGPTAVDSLKNKGENFDGYVYHKKVFALAELVKERS